MRKLYLLLTFLFLSTFAVADAGAPIYNYKLAPSTATPPPSPPTRAKSSSSSTSPAPAASPRSTPRSRAVYEKYKDKGLVIIGVPANNFANQESGTNADHQDLLQLASSTSSSP